jgi:hypothetical protein
LEVGLFDPDGVELSYEGYRRVAVERSSVAWTASGSTVWNAEAIRFPEVFDWTGEASSFAIFVDDVKLFEGPLRTPQKLTTGSTFEFPRGGISITQE